MITRTDGQGFTEENFERNENEEIFSPCLFFCFNGKSILFRNQNVRYPLKMWRFLFRGKSFSKQISSSKFLTLSIANYELSLKCLDKIWKYFWGYCITVTCGLSHLLEWSHSTFPIYYCFVSGKWISAQVFNRSITRVMCSSAQQIPKPLKTRLTQDVQNITFWATCTCSGTEGRVPIFPLAWF